MKVVMQYKVLKDICEVTLDGEKCGYSIEPSMAHKDVMSWNRTVRIWNEHESVTVAFPALVFVRMIEDSGSSREQARRLPERKMRCSGLTGNEP